MSLVEFAMRNYININISLCYNTGNTIVECSSNKFDTCIKYSFTRFEVENAPTGFLEAQVINELTRLNL